MHDPAQAMPKFAKPNSSAKKYQKHLSGSFLTYAEKTCLWFIFNNPLSRISVTKRKLVLIAAFSFKHNFYFQLKIRRIVALTGDRALVAFANLESVKEKLQKLSLDAKNVLEQSNPEEVRGAQKSLNKFLTDLSSKVIPFAGNI